MTPGHEKVTADFGGILRLTGWRSELHRIEIVLDDEYSDDDAVAILDGLTVTLGATHPALRTKLVQILFPRTHHPEEPLTGGTADGATGQVCFWLTRPSWLGLPHADIGLVEHECAHMLFPGGGPPDDAAWLRAMKHDQQDSPEILVDQTIREVYPEAAHLQEDWANSVARLLESDRGDRSFRRRFEHRARIIDLTLAGAAPQDTPIL